MRKYFSFVLAVLFAGSAMWAAPVSPERALEVAQQFVSSSPAFAPGQGGVSPAVSVPSVAATLPMPKSGNPAFYIANVGNAFVLVSADDAVPQVLGYNIGSGWPTDKPIPSQVRFFFNCLAERVEAGAQSSGSTSERVKVMAQQAIATSQLPDSVGPLMTTRWDQSPYYNSQCPEAPNGVDGHVVVGCEATSIAQIMKYWGFPSHGRGKHTYVSDYDGETYGPLTVDFDSATYNYALMPDTLSSSSTPEEINEVAKLMYHCGVAQTMTYGENDSYSDDPYARAAMVDHFYFDPNCEYKIRSEYSDEEWDSFVRADLAAGRPVLYGGEAVAGGHSFVCDGYNSSGYFHFNFGWQGYGDGWYLLSFPGPSENFIFSGRQSAVFGLQPDTTMSGKVFYACSGGTRWFTLDEPAEFYHVRGNSSQSRINYGDRVSSTFLFTLRDTTKHMVMDVLSYDRQKVVVYTSDTADAPAFILDSSVKSYPAVVSDKSTLELYYDGDLYYRGFCLRLSPEEECRMVSNLEKEVLDTANVLLTWKENGAATEWQVEYGLSGFARGEGVLVTTNDTVFVADSLEQFGHYDFYVRPNCGGEWLSLKSVTVREPYWHETLSLYIEGLDVDQETQEMYVYSEEGLAGVYAFMNAGYRDYKVHIMEDIDMGAYWWKSMPAVKGNIDGHGHTISNLRVLQEGKDSHLGCGFLQNFGKSYHPADTLQRRDTIQNLFFRNPELVCLPSTVSKDTSSVYGIGVLSGAMHGGTILNCGVHGATIRHGDTFVWDAVGGFVGVMNNSEIVNSCFTGNISSEVQYVGSFAGGLGSGANYVFNSYYHTLPSLSISGNEVSPYANNVFMADTIGSDDLVQALNAWLDSNDQEGVYYRWSADVEQINNGYPVLNPALGPNTRIMDNQAELSTAVEKVFRDGQVYIRRGGVEYDVTGRQVHLFPKNVK